MNCVFKLIAPFVALPSLLAFGQSHLVIDTDAYRYSASFDMNRITKQRLRELLVFSPYDMDDIWKLDHQQLNMLRSETPTGLQEEIGGNELELCDSGDSRYFPCGTRDITDPNFLANAEINLAMNQQASEALNRVTVPPELRTILKQFRDSFSFWTTVERKRLAYLRSGDLSILAEPIGNINPSAECAGEIEQVNQATTLKQQYDLSLYGWQNCLNSVWNRTSPAYPRADWQRFLRTYGITEQFTEKSVD